MSWAEAKYIIDEVGKKIEAHAPVWPQIVVTAPTGSTVTATQGDKVLTAEEVSGTWTFDVPTYGEWSIHATLGEDEKTKIVNVAEVKRYTLTITYFVATISVDTEEGATVTASIGSTSYTSQAVDGVATFSVEMPGTYELECSVDGVKAVNKAYAIVETKGSTVKAAVGFVYGYQRTKATTDPAGRIAYTDDCVGFSPAAMDFSNSVFLYGSWEAFCTEINRPVMLKYDGTEDYELDRNDQTKRADGTSSDITSTSYGGNAMSAFKKLYVCREDDGTYETVKFSRFKLNDSYKAYAHTNANGVERDYFYYSMFKGSNVSSVLRSIAGQGVMASQTAATEMTYAKANNTKGGISGDGWNTIYKSQWDFINDLLTLITKSDNNQATLGWGRCASGNSAGITPGGLKAKGQFFGYTDQTSSVKVFYIEDFYGNYWDRMAGMVLIGGKVYTKMTGPYPAPTNDAATYTGAGYVDSGVTVGGTSGQIVTAAVMSEQGYIPKTASGGTSDNTAYCDGLWFNASQVDYALVGGSWSNGVLVGGRCVDLSYLASITSANFVSRLSYLAP